MLWISFLDYASWVLSAALGGIFGSLLSFETKGIDFAMTSMFVVIFLEQFLNDTQHLTAYIGFAAAIVCLMLFGPNSFIIPTMLGILAMVTLFRKQIERAGGMTK